MTKKNYLLLDEILKKNHFLNDIWIYGNGTFRNKRDSVSDLDLIFVYNKKKFNKVKFPHFIKKQIEGSIIYISKEKSKSIMLFEKLKIFSLKKKHFLNFDIDKKFIRFREITSFIERYYERKKILKFNLKKLNNKKIGRIKSLIFSYYVFSKTFKFNSKKKLDIIYNEYKLIRYKYSKNTLSQKKLNKFIARLKIFDDFFFKESSLTLNNLYNWSDVKEFSYLFQKKYFFKYNKNKQINDVPQIFGYIYDFYAKQKLTLSKKIKSNFDSNKSIYKERIKLLDKYLFDKISFLNENYKDLKKNNLKKGMYRFSWYL